MRESPIDPWDGPNGMWKFPSQIGVFDPGDHSF